MFIIMPTLQLQSESKFLSYSLVQMFLCIFFILINIYLLFLISNHLLKKWWRGIQSVERMEKKKTKDHVMLL